LKKVLDAFSVPIFEKQGYEADDIIGTISQKAEKQQVYPKPEIIILTGDLDALQLIDNNTRVYALRKGVKDTVLYDELLVKERYDGLNPSQLLDFRALRGDPSDNIPGVTGIGEKTAIKLLKEFGTLENLYKNINQPSSIIHQALKAKLLEYKEQAFLSRDLAEMKKDAPIEFALEKCRFGEYDKEKAVRILQELEFNSLVKRLPSAEQNHSSKQSQIEFKF
jgi:DNA polymerase-1